MVGQIFRIRLGVCQNGAVTCDDTYPHVHFIANRLCNRLRIIACFQRQRRNLRHIQQVLLGFLGHAVVEHKSRQQQCADKAYTNHREVSP